MTISWLQAAILGIFACLSSMPGMGGSAIGNYTLGRPLVAGLVCGIVLGDIQAGILVGAAMQVVYIALVTPGGTVSADVRAVSYIGIPLAMLALNSYGLSASSEEGIAMATSFGAMVGTLGTVLFYGTATINLVWQHIGWKAVEKGEFKKLYLVDMVLPWISHLLCSFIPAMVMCKLGVPVVDAIILSIPQKKDICKLSSIPIYKCHFFYDKCHIIHLTYRLPVPLYPVYFHQSYHPFPSIC